MPPRVPKTSEKVFAEDHFAALQNFSISDFAPFEALVGQKLTAVLRDTLTNAAETYLRQRADEIFSPTVVEATRRLADIKSKAGALRKALLATNAKHVGFLVGNTINEHLNGGLNDRTFSRRISQKIDSTTVSLLMKDLERACGSSIRSLNEVAVPSKSSWVQLVGNLEDWAEKAGLKVTVSKRLKSKLGDDLTPTRFVRLVDALQTQLPVVFRQHLQSKEALVNAIHLARVKNRKGP